MSPTPKTTFLREAARWGHFWQTRTRLRNSATAFARSGASATTGTTGGTGVGAGGGAGVEGWPKPAAIGASRSGAASARCKGSCLGAGISGFTGARAGAVPAVRDLSGGQGRESLLRNRHVTNPFLLQALEVVYRCIQKTMKGRDHLAGGRKASPPGQFRRIGMTT